MAMIELSRWRRSSASLPVLDHRPWREAELGQRPRLRVSELAYPKRGFLVV